MGRGRVIYRPRPFTPRLPAQVMVQFFLGGGCRRGWPGKTPQRSGQHFPGTFERHLLVETMWPQNTEEALCLGQNGSAPGRKEMDSMEESPTPGCCQSENLLGHLYTKSLLPVELVASSSFTSSSTSSASSSSGNSFRDT